MIYGEKNVEKPIRWAMVGGGVGSQIGYIHRSAALRDFNFELVAGAFDIDPERGKAFGEKLHVAADRCYPDYKTMFAEEAKREDGIQAVSIATPNFTHYEIAKAALEAGLHVYCEKPMCFTTEQAMDLKAAVEKSGKIFFVSYGYAGHQLIEQARQMVANGDLGTHVLYLIEAICPDMKIQSLMCTKQSFVEGRALEDNAMSVMKYDNGAIAYIWSSSINAGASFGFDLRIVGEKGSIAWNAETPNFITYEVQGQAPVTLGRGSGVLYPAALADDRIGGGHPEGLFEAWSNVYTKFAKAIDKTEKGEKIDFWYPGIDAGVEGVKWVEKCVESGDNNSAWVEY